MKGKGCEKNEVFAKFPSLLTKIAHIPDIHALEYSALPYFYY